MYKLNYIEKEISAFLRLRESKEAIDDNALVLAIAKYSDEGYSFFNVLTYEDTTIQDPLPLLKCAWSFVYSEYQVLK